jgi:hypothetical protein
MEQPRNEQTPSCRSPSPIGARSLQLLDELVAESRHLPTSREAETDVILTDDGHDFGLARRDTRRLASTPIAQLSTVIRICPDGDSELSTVSSRSDSVFGIRDISRDVNSQEIICESFDDLSQCDSHISDL